jgi:hypothetical protein
VDARAAVDDWRARGRRSRVVMALPNKNSEIRCLTAITRALNYFAFFRPWLSNGGWESRQLNWGCCRGRWRVLAAAQYLRPWKRTGGPLCKPVAGVGAAESQDSHPSGQGMLQCILISIKRARFSSAAPGSAH